MDCDGHPIVLFDGLCGLCDRTVRFLLKRDRQDCFRFASLQSEFARKVLAKHQIASEHLETIYLVLNYAKSAEVLLSRSVAISEVWSRLDWPWSIFGWLVRALPRQFADWGYNMVARHRYRLFGRYDSCLLPPEDFRYRFLEI